jgi:hypothetical protein
MSLRGKVRVAQRYQRSVRIDADLGSKTSLDGFIFSETSHDVLISMSQHIAKTKQGAFTWTGPYGCGKSSLVIALSALLSGNSKSRKVAAESIGEDAATTIWTNMPPNTAGWKILPVVGRRDRPAQVIGEAIFDSRFCAEPRSSWADKNVVEELQSIAGSSKKHGGLIVFIDEMGKFLESLAHEGTDIHLFQDLAEVASRSKGRLIIVGILHQAFEEYGRKLSREMRDEWSKIHGRFIDLSVNSAGEEQIELLSRAIETEGEGDDISATATEVADIVRLKRPNTSLRMADMLADCWPLHPVTACLLGPISKRRFGQNQRSLFGFLNSAEASGFQEFLDANVTDGLYKPGLLWDYLRTNLEPAILSSPDGHRWASAAESLDRCEAQGAPELEAELLKTIALIDTFKEQSGLTAGVQILSLCFQPGYSSKKIAKALEQLTKQSLVIYQKHREAYAIFGGSDFDIETAIESGVNEVREIDFNVLRKLAGFQPVLAKKHFHDTGTLRWFDVDIVPANKLMEVVNDYVPSKGSIGQFLLCIPTENETEEDVKNNISRIDDDHLWHKLVIGLSKRSWSIRDRARELIAVENIRQDSPELKGDNVARREVQARMISLLEILERELSLAFDSAVWHLGNEEPKRLLYSQLSGFASSLSDQLFPDAPKLHNELLNRHKPSGSATAAQNVLLRQMVSHQEELNLGIVGYPAERGLYESLLKKSKLHRLEAGEFGFVRPKSKGPQGCRLAPLWNATEGLLKNSRDRSVNVTELYEMWREPPFGIRDGLMPVLMVAFLMSCRGTIALYREGIFQTKLKELDVEYLAMDPDSIQIRWMDLSKIVRNLLAGMADIVRDIDPSNELKNLEPIDVARGLISIFDNLQPWTHRTSHLSKNALRLRDVFKRANDPNQLIFNDLPGTADTENPGSADKGSKGIIMQVREGLTELVDAYPSMLERFYQIMLAELGVPNKSSQSLAELNERAKNISGVTGDFKMDAFAGRLSGFEGTPNQFEDLASLAVNKPTKTWIDTDVDKANLEIARLSKQFLNAEAFAHVKGRKNKRQAMAFVVGGDDISSSVLKEFDVADADHASVQKIITALEEAMNHIEDKRSNVVLAALSKISSSYMVDERNESTKTGEERRVS